MCGHGSRPAASPDGKPNVRSVIATEGSTRPPACQASDASEGIVDALDSAVGYVQAEGREKVEGRPSGWATGYVPAEGGDYGSDCAARGWCPHEEGGCLKVGRPRRRGPAQSLQAESSDLTPLLRHLVQRCLRRNFSLSLRVQ